jgi:transcriptional regulator with XRE-family HTH domain
VSSFSLYAERIAERLAEIRASKKLSAQGFADMLADAGEHELTHVTVLAYESTEGTGKVPAAYCLAVAKACGLPVEYVLALTDDPHPPAPDVAGQTVAAVRMLLDMASRDPTKVSRVLATIEAIQRARGGGD